jgi:formate dehydrogenase subunit beta
MSIQAILEVKDGDVLAALREFLWQLLDREIVDALMVPLELPSGDAIAQTLVKDADKLEKANPLAPVMMVNSANLVSNLTRRGNREKVGVVLKSCEMRALIELVKLQQANLDNLLTIGIDCLGTYEVTQYAPLSKELGDGAGPSAGQLQAAKEGDVVPHDGYEFRAACQMCEYPIPMNVDINVALIGVDAATMIVLEMEQAIGKEIVEKLGLQEAEAASREEAVAKLVAAREMKPSPSSTRL